MKRKIRIESALIKIKTSIQNKEKMGGGGVRQKDLYLIYPNSFFWKAVNKIGLIENKGTDKNPDWLWTGGRIVKGDIQFIEDFMCNKERQRMLR